MDWSQSYSAIWRVFRVNRKTWADAEQVTNVDSVNITRTADGLLLESGSLEVTGDFEPDYYRIAMTAEQGGEVTRVDIATLLFDVNGGKYNYNTEVQNVDGYSVLYPASTTTVVMGEYAPAGVDGAAYVADLLRSAINAPVEVDGSFFLNDHVVYELGTSVLDAAWAVLDAGGFVIQIDGRGTVHVVPKPTEPALVLDNSNARLLQNGVSYESDLSEIPNRYVVILDSSRTIAENNDTESIVSLPSRGYCVDYVDESPTPVNGETMNAYALRRLHELSVQKDTRTYTREYSPDVNLYSIVKASMDALQGDLRVESQTIRCGYGVTVEEKAVREVSLWQ